MHALSMAKESHSEIGYSTAQGCGPPTNIAMERTLQIMYQKYALRNNNERL